MPQAWPALPKLILRVCRRRLRLATCHREEAKARQPTLLAGWLAVGVVRRQDSNDPRTL